MESIQPVKAPKNGSKPKEKYNLAVRILNFGMIAVAILGIGALGAVVLSKSKTLEPFNAIKDILSILLPVISVWVGAVIAHYFTNKSYEAATRGTVEIFGKMSPEEKLRSIQVKEVMKPIDKAIYLTLAKKEADIQIKKDLIDGNFEKDKQKTVNRLPILDKDKRPKYIIHRSLIDKFIAEKSLAGKPTPKLTLKDLLDDAKFKEYLEGSYRTMKEFSNLAEAKTIMDNIKSCLDIFITRDGSKGSEVIGWLTNVAIMRELDA